MWYNWLILVTRLLHVVAEETSGGLFRTAFAILPVCPNCCYGNPIKAFTKIKSPILCSKLCSSEPECQSWMFNPDTSTCRANADVLTEVSASCPQLIRYGFSLNVQHNSNEDTPKPALLTDHLQACAECCYGSTIGSYENISSRVGCNEKCSEDPACQSYLYIPEKSVCRTNAMPLISMTSTCPDTPRFEGKKSQSETDDQLDDYLSEGSGGSGVDGSDDEPDNE